MAALLVAACVIPACQTPSPSPSHTGAETSDTSDATGVIEKKTWYGTVLEASDVASALAGSSQAGSIPAGAAAEAAKELPGWLKEHVSTRDSQSASAALSGFSIGGVTFLHDVVYRGDGGQLETPVWTSMADMTLYRVSVVSGKRFVGEYVVQYDEEPTPVLHLDDEVARLVTDEPLGSYSVAQDAARVLLWRHFGQRPFKFMVTYSELSAGTWVFGHCGKSTAGVYLGDCSEGEPPSFDKRVQTVVTPGVVYDEKGIEREYYLVSQRVQPPS